MTPQGSELEIDIAGFASRLIEAQETVARARIVAQVIVDRIAETSVAVYLLQEDGSGPFWLLRASVGEGVQPDHAVPAEAGTLGSIFCNRQAAVFEGRTLAPSYRNSMQHIRPVVLAGS